MPHHQYSTLEGIDLHDFGDHEHGRETWESSRKIDVPKENYIDRGLANEVKENDEINEDSRKDFVVNSLEELASEVLTQLATIMQFCDIESGNNDSKEDRRNRQIDIELASRKEGSAFRHLKWPRKKGATRSLASLLRIVDLCHSALIQNITITKREIFYHDVALFKTQSTVDKLVDDLAATFGVGRADLNVVASTASPKGLASGSSIQLLLTSENIIVLSPTEATLIPPGEDIARVTINEDFGFVLVVEKEAVFQTLRSVGFAECNALSRHGLIVTGKGQPDIATRQLVHTLGEILPEAIPILILVDADVYGLEIASVYKHGSKGMKHEAENLTCPRAHWIGISGSDITSLGIHNDHLLHITKRDHKKVIRATCPDTQLVIPFSLMTARTKTLEMLSRPSTVMPSSWKHELVHLLHKRRKAEIEIISTASFCNIPIPAAFSQRPDLKAAWNALAGGPLLVPFLVSKMTALLPPHDS